MNSTATTSDIEKALYYELEKRAKYMCPGKHLRNWFECDFLSVTRSDFLHEYEIKVSKSDFKADFKKTAKHLLLEGKERLFVGENDPKLNTFRRADNRKRKYIKEDSGSAGYMYDFSDLEKPNYFWYVTPEGLLTADDIPPYAGWMEVRKTNAIRHQGLRCFTRKEAPRLHAQKIASESILNILESMCHRFWNLRILAD